MVTEVSSYIPSGFNRRFFFCNINYIGQSGYRNVVLNETCTRFVVFVSYCIDVLESFTGAHYLEVGRTIMHCMWLSYSYVAS